MRYFELAVAAATLSFFIPVISMAADSAKTRAEADPSIQAALTQSMKTLGDRAIKKVPQDSLDLGLAMLAGRGGGIATDPAGDAARVTALEQRTQPLIEAYLKAHPGSDPGRINWGTVVQETPDEVAFVEHYEQVYSADYWVENAIYALDAHEVFVPRRPTLNTAVNGEARVADALEMERAIDPNLILTAAHCIVAVRREAKIDYQPWSSLPLVIRLLQTLPRQDLQLRVDTDLVAGAPKTKYVTGPAACGTDDQFKADVAALKAAP